MKGFFQKNGFCKAHSQDTINEFHKKEKHNNLCLQLGCAKWREEKPQRKPLKPLDIAKVLKYVNRNSDTQKSS